MNKEGTIYTVIFIFIVSFAFVFLLSLTNQATIGRVELNREITRQSAILSAMGITATTPEEVQSAYAKVAADDTAGLYIAHVNGETIYAAYFAGPGLWGTIEGFLAVRSDFSQIVGIEILSDTETPGLGARINEAWFKNQFRGETIPASGITVRQLPGDGDANKSDGLIDGITGATRTSDSMQAIVNNELLTLQSRQTRTILQNLSTQGGNS